MKKAKNNLCAQCPKAHDSINGRYCNKLRKYVQYATEPPCKK